jgi:hypothetical protein
LPISSLSSEYYHSEDGAERQQTQTKGQPANSAAPAGTARNPTAVPSDSVVATNSDNKEQFINAVLSLGDIITSSHPSTTKIQKVKEPNIFDGTILASLINGSLKLPCTSLQTLQYLNPMKTKCSLLYLISVNKL